MMDIFHSFDFTDICIWWRINCSIQLDQASLNKIYHLSPNENICTIALISFHCLHNNIWNKISFYVGPIMLINFFG